MVSVSPQSIMGPAGGKHSSTCSVIKTGSSVAPTFEWLQNGIPPPNSLSLNTSNLTPDRFSNQLTLNPLSQPSHGGAIITCRVSLGSVEMGTAQVSVIVNGIITI